MTDQWKAEVRASMAAKGWSDADLGRAIGKGRDTIGKMFKSTTSALVPAICEVLGVGPPTTPTPELPDEKTQRVLTLIAKADEKVIDSVIILLESASIRR